MRVRQALGLALLVPVLAAGPTLAAPAANAHLPAPKPSSRADLSRTSRSARNLAQPKAGGIQLQIDSFGGKPWVTDNDTLTLSGTLSNQSGQPITGDVEVQLSYGHALVSRGQISTEPPPPATRFAQNQKLSVPIPSGSNPAWKLSLKAANLAPTRDLGVYPLKVAATEIATGRTLGEQTTFVVFAPKNPNKSATLKRTKIAWVLPLMDQPRRIRTPRPASTDLPVFQDDRLDQEFGPDGRLSELLKAGQGVKTQVTWAIDPALLAAAADMASSKGYQVDGNKQKSAKSLNAETWLAGLKSSTNPYFAVPYADPDAVAMLRQKKSQLNQLLQQSIDQGRSTATAQLGRAPDLAMYWPADGVADSRTLGRFAPGSAPDMNFLLSSTQLTSTVTNERYTPSATSSVRVNGKTRTALAYDSTISDAISADSSTPAGKTQAEQLYLAQTALMTAETNQQRNLVVAPDRRWNPQNGLATALINDTAGAPWLQTVGLGDLLKDRTQSDRVHTVSYPQQERGRELSSGYLAGVSDASDAADGLASIYLKWHNDFQLGLFGAVSSAYRNGNPAGGRFAASLKSQLKNTLGMVHLVDNKNATMAGTQVNQPYTLVNGLPERVQVLLEVSSKYPTRLQIATNSSAMIVPIDPGTKHGVFITMRSNANGVTPVSLNIFTLRPKVRMRDPMITYVSTAGYVQTAFIITAVGLVVLFVGVGVRFTRARKRRKQVEERDDAAGHPAPDGEHTAG